VKHFCFLLLDGFSQLAFSSAVEPLRLANHVSGQELYQISLASQDGRAVRCLNGFELSVHHSFRDLPECDHLFVLTSKDMRRQNSPELAKALRFHNSHGTKVGGLCSGAWILAELCFLNGMTAALHWDHHESFRETFPDVDLVGRVFVAIERHLTAAGGTATADLMLHLIEEEHDRNLAIMIADQMVYSGVREEKVEQRISLQARIGARNSHLARAVEIIHNTLEEPVSPSGISQAIGISTRQLERLFRKHLHTTPKKYTMDNRLERAQKLLLQTEHSVIEVSMACGFENPGHFARVYRRKYGSTPKVQRNKLNA
jgi:transcriptional regulator GlxA family with amidase domain